MGVQSIRLNSEVEKNAPLAPSKGLFTNLKPA